MKKLGREFLQSRAFKIGVLGCLVVSMMICTAFAVEGDTSSSTSVITSAFQTGFQQLASDILVMIAIIVPIALGVAGTIFLARKAMGWFKSIAK